jgi:hypothetical protein
MSKSGLPTLLVALSLAWSAASVAADDKKPRPPTQAPGGIDQCARVSASARMEAYGYTHLVTLQNRCDRRVVCEVWTDVDPTPRQTLSAAPGATEEAITRRGSPAREVTAESSCHFE